MLNKHNYILDVVVIFGTILHIYIYIPIHITYSQYHNYIHARTLHSVRIMLYGYLYTCYVDIYAYIKDKLNLEEK